MFAGASFLVAALLHEVFSRRLEQREIDGQLDQVYEEIDDLREVNRGLMADVVRAHEEMAVLCYVVETAADDTNQALVREMKVLQSQLGQFGDVRPPAAANASRASRRTGGTRRRSSADQASSLVPSPVPAQRQPVAAPTPEDCFANEEILGHISEALETNCIGLYPQPIVSLPQRRARHFEAFSRIRTSDGRIVTPAQYIKVAKEQGLIGTIDNLLLMRCVQLLRRTEKRKNHVDFFVNISIHTLNDAEFMSQFIDFMAHNPSLAARLIFEITQSDVAALTETVWQQLGRLGELGFRFSMDQVDDLEIDFQILVQVQFRFIKVPINLIMTLP